MKIRREFIKETWTNDPKILEGFPEVFEKIMDASEDIFKGHSTSAVLNATMHFCSTIMALAARAKALGPEVTDEDFAATMSYTLGSQIISNIKYLEDSENGQ